MLKFQTYWKFQHVKIYIRYQKFQYVRNSDTPVTLSSGCTDCSHTGVSVIRWSIIFMLAIDFSSICPHVYMQNYIIPMYYVLLTIAFHCTNVIILHNVEHFTITTPVRLLHPTLVWRFQEAANIPTQDDAWPVCPLVLWHYHYSFTPEWGEALSI